MLRATCASSQPASFRRFPAISSIQNGERKRLETSSTMFCHKCGGEFGNNVTFCRWCGTLKRREQESVLSSTKGERLAIEHHFKRGFCYDTIVHFLAEYHGISMNVRTLKRRLRHYGLRRRNHLHSEHAGTVREIIKREIVSPSSLLGYRGMWNKLRTTYHVTVPRDMVMKILRELDPDASALRRARKLQRRSYVSPGPNATWHVDGT